MASTATVSASVTSNDGARDRISVPVSTTVTVATAMADGKVETYALTAAFQALTVPTGSQGVLIRLVSGAVTLTLKGVTGDTGIVLQSGTLSTVPIMVPLGTSPSIGILSSGTGVVECVWF